MFWKGIFIGILFGSALTIWCFGIMIAYYTKNKW